MESLKKIKVGDLVKKILGARDLDKVGIVTNVYNDFFAAAEKRFLIVSVLSDKKISNWAAHLVEVVNESR